MKKQESVFYLGLQEAEILGTNEAFQPKLRLENIYDNPERWTSMQLPPLPRKSSSSSSDSEDEIRTDEEEISKTMSRKSRWLTGWPSSIKGVVKAPCG